MNQRERAKWDQRHLEGSPGAPEPSLVELLPLIPTGLTLDVAAGSGRHAIAMARAGHRVVAADFSAVAMRQLDKIARADGLPITPIVVDLEDALPFRRGHFDCIVNVSFLDRALVPHLKKLLRIGGTLFFDTFLIDQATLGHPRDPRFLLKHNELREMLSEMELISYHEGLVHYSSEKRAWRATVLARRRA